MLTRTHLRRALAAATTTCAVTACALGAAAPAAAAPDLEAASELLAAVGTPTTDLGTDRAFRDRAESVSRSAPTMRQRVSPRVKLKPKPKPKPWVLPVTGYRLTGRFGASSGLWATTHTGLDFAAAEGSEIRSIGPGVVRSTAYEGAYGNKTVVRLNDGTVLWYCHQSDFGVEPGQRVKQGDLIGYVGSTGNSTGPHLHLEVHRGNGPVDPESWLSRHKLRA